MAISFLGALRRPDGPDREFVQRCARALEDLRAMSDVDLLAALADPRQLHGTLHRDLAPAGSPELAGNFRGSDFATLRDAIVFYSFNDTEGTTSIAGPHRVPELMAQYAGLVREHGLRRFATVDEKLSMVAAIMAFFGAIHPFVDGNGLVQRLTAQCLLERGGLVMAPAWRVHPCPYGEDMHRALAARDERAVAAKLKSFVA
jgi:Fic family protein